MNNADEGMPDQYVPVRLIASSSTGGWLTREAYRYTTLSYSAIPHSTLLYYNRIDHIMLIFEIPIIILSPLQCY